MRTEEEEEDEEEAAEEVDEGEQTSVDKIVEEVEKAAALEVELEEPAVPAPAPAPAPAAAPAVSAVGSTAVQQSKQELVPLYLLRMRLPSKYLLQEVEYQEKTEIRRFADDRASALETLRRRIYEQISRVFCAVEEYGVWVAVTPEAVKEAAELGGLVKDELKRLGFGEDIIRRYDIKAIKAYFESNEAKDLLEAAIKQLSADIAELEQKIAQAEAEAKKSAVRRLAQDAQYKRALLEAFKKALASL